ncbi:MAG: tetratricopeptide repeat protein [Myxococcota bacterium]|nr:tetratricopeptide repeat protein [Myxococcota bacterium]
MRPERAVLCAAFACLAAGTTGADGMILWGATSPLVQGTRAVAAEQYRRGADLLEEALESRLPAHERSLALANLCAAYSGLGLGLGFGDAALGRCADAIAADASNWRSFSNRGAILLGRGRFADAAADFREALRLEPSAAAARLGLQRAVGVRDTAPAERGI